MRGTIPITLVGSTLILTPGFLKPQGGSWVSLDCSFRCGIPAAFGLTSRLMGRDHFLIAKRWSLIGSMGGSFMETASEGTAASCGNLGGKSEGSEISGTPEVIPEDSGSSDDRDKRENVWWKMPVELLKFCIFRVREKPV
ncbi:hypothetical protein MA16_Dca029092 [Dendrobium catenatum]|uniref:Uncharacterized protein n=2 Tax=Dendrobium catenatum TaxID=906689 RepID=A0A2I0V815_9ASPA|nr:hypothetical protein MA16_Dca029092 [Dendrobium catenatum]